MYNTDIPSRSALPTPMQLHRSTFIAACVAVVLVFTAYLPAEYGIDPTGIGGLTGLTEMGMIKTQLHEEAEADRLKNSSPAPTPERRSNVAEFTFAQLFSGSAAAHEAGHGNTLGAGAHRDAIQGGERKMAAGRKDEMSLTLKPGQGAEIKLRMKKGAKATYSWIVTGGTANFDMHGDGRGGVEKSYKRGRAVGGDEGVLEAAFNGNHGWFWRNRTRKPVTVKLWVNGD